MYRERERETPREKETELIKCGQAEPLTVKHLILLPFYSIYELHLFNTLRFPSEFNFQLNIGPINSLPSPFKIQQICSPTAQTHVYSEISPSDRSTAHFCVSSS